jgi:hypothetical protein
MSVLAGQVHVEYDQIGALEGGLQPLKILGGLDAIARNGSLNGNLRQPESLSDQPNVAGIIVNEQNAKTPRVHCNRESLRGESTSTTTSGKPQNNNLFNNLAAIRSRPPGKNGYEVEKNPWNGFTRRQTPDWPIDSALHSFLAYKLRQRSVLRSFSDGILAPQSREAD